MKQLAALAVLLLAVGCAIPQTGPASFEESGLFAAATQTSVASYYNATAQAADATRTAQMAQATATAAAFYAGATATSQAAAQQTAVAATATTAWLTTRENREAVAFQAGINATATIYAHQANATATRMQQQAELDAKRARRSDLWGWLGMAAILLLIVGLLWVLRAQADAIRMRSEVRTDSRGNLIAFLTPDGWQLASPRLLPPVIENPPQPPREPERRTVEVNGQTIDLRRPAKLIEYAGDSYQFTGKQLDRLGGWYRQGHTSIRRETSNAGPGFDAIGAGSGSVYGRLLTILQGRGYVDQNNEWTTLGVRELLEVENRHPTPVM